ncbi:MAG: DUF3127 domain-containing protein [Flavobacteriales bacterium]|nr:DUF3127 domain-containing protein [Flavobacteriales bacterium]
MNIRLEGTLLVIRDMEVIGGKFKKRECVLKTKEQYVQEILIEFTQDDCSMLNGYEVGELVSIDVDIRGRKWTNPEGIDKYFNSLKGWRISLLNS